MISCQKSCAMVVTSIWLIFTWHGTIRLTPFFFPFFLLFFVFCFVFCLFVCLFVCLLVFLCCFSLRELECVALIDLIFYLLCVVWLMCCLCCCCMFSVQWLSFCPSCSVFVVCVFLCGGLILLYLCCCCAVVLVLLLCLCVSIVFVFLVCLTTLQDPPKYGIFFCLEELGIFDRRFATRTSWERDDFLEISLFQRVFIIRAVCILK